ncbi:hypothetical protein [Anaerolinea thermophila]|uniref:Uncharacterized protein n=1 Tax=Anaerolinea thermophila (strain DSM 14523 / JCM 11388 / NBRC 100420 / UNI-1) TaxID=926569 RepID=E8N5K9_ANATU|nr:hypothetical protein [Anaerolinea thermophila]BAJ63723.1 hypothetical protein ANT_16970 [Anaerolinea thermophila UNI-1]
MLNLFSRLLDRLSEFLASRKGLLPLIGMLLIFLNLLFSIFAPSGWLAQTDLLLHIGIILAIFGIMLAWAL